MSLQVLASPSGGQTDPESDGMDRSGLEQRMQVVFDANARALFRYLLGLTHGQREAAEDLVQETMLRAWRNLEWLPDDAQKVRRWLFTVARNVAIDWARARMARPNEVWLGDISWPRSPGDAFEELVERHTLRDALERLTPEHRTVLALLYFRGASVAETAKLLGIPEGTVRSRAFYALRLARGILRRTNE